MRNPPPTPSPTSPSGDTSPADRRLRRKRWALPALGGLAVSLGALLFGYLLGADYWEAEASDPFDAIAAMQQAGLTCIHGIRTDESGGERTAVCLSTRNEVVTVGTFTDRPDPDDWAAELCEATANSIVPVQGALVVFDNTLVTVVSGPLPSEQGGPVPDPAGLASSIATALDGEWQRYQC